MLESEGSCMSFCQSDQVTAVLPSGKAVTGKATQKWSTESICTSRHFLLLVAPATPPAQATASLVWTLEVPLGCSPTVLLPVAVPFLCLQPAMASDVKLALGARGPVLSSHR